MKRSVLGRAVLAVLVMSTTAANCDREDSPSEGPGAAAAAVDTPLAGPAGNENTTQPDEIYFNLTEFAWYREGRPLVHNGRSYMPQAEPTPAEVQLKEAGSFEGVTYYTAEDAPEPVYTLYVPVYYRYWQRFTAPPGG